MQTITTIGLDIAKSVFQVHGVDAEGKAIIRREPNMRISQFSIILFQVAEEVPECNTFPTNNSFHLEELEIIAPNQLSHCGSFLPLEKFCRNITRLKPGNCSCRKACRVRAHAVLP